MYYPPYVVLLGIFVVAPKLVQMSVDDADLSFEAVILSNPKLQSLMMNATGITIYT